MSVKFYKNSGEYIDSADDLCAKIEKINQVIDGLESLAVQVVAKADIDEYSLDDGQTKIKVVNNSPAAIANMINEYEKIKQRYINRIDGRAVRLIDEKNLRRWG